MKKETINPEGLSRRPFYSHVVKAGDTVYIAGQIARDRNGKTVGVGDAKAQIEQIFKNLEACLDAAGGNLRLFLPETGPKAKRRI